MGVRTVMIRWEFVILQDVPAGAPFIPQDLFEQYEAIIICVTNPSSSSEASLGESHLASSLQRHRQPGLESEMERRRVGYWDRCL